MNGTIDKIKDAVVKLMPLNKAKKRKFIVSQAFYFQIHAGCAFLFYFLWTGHVYATPISVITRDKIY